MNLELHDCGQILVRKWWKNSKTVLFSIPCRVHEDVHWIFESLVPFLIFLIGVLLFVHGLRAWNIWNRNQKSQNRNQELENPGRWGIRRSVGSWFLSRLVNAILTVKGHLGSFYLLSFIFEKKNSMWVFAFKIWIEPLS